MSLVSAAGSLGGHAGDYRDPAISPDGEPTTTTPLADVQRQAHESLAAKWNPELEKFSAEEILDWADEHVAGSIAVTMSMQDTVLAELAEGDCVTQSWCSWIRVTTLMRPFRLATKWPSATDFH